MNNAPETIETDKTHVIEGALMEMTTEAIEIMNYSVSTVNGGCQDVATSKSEQLLTDNMPTIKAPEEPIAPSFFPLFYNQFTGLHYRSVPLPSCEGEVSWRSDVKREGCQNQRNILMALFQNVPQKNTDSIYYVFGDFIVFHEAVFLAEVNIYFPPGGWLNRVTNEFGFDAISLCVAVQGIPYYTALERLAKWVRIAPKEINAKPKGEHSRYVNEKNPLTVLYIPGSAFPDYPKQFAAGYFSSSGQIIAIVEYYHTYSGKTVKIFHTLWRHHQSQILHWHDFFPEPPYPLFNLHLLAQRPYALVIIVADELRAYQLQNQFYDGRIYTTCPGGLSNLPDADLTALRWNTVMVEMVSFSPEVQRLPDFIKKIAEIGNNSVVIIFDGNYNSPVAADIFLKTPEKWGGKLDDCEYAGNEIVITPPGEKIPGEDKIRPMVLDPIIKAGHKIWLYAPAKVGKTWFALSAAYVVAKGGCKFVRWRSSKKPKRVLYIDGEMLPDELAKNIRMIMAGFGDSGQRPFHVYNAKATKSGFMDILDPAWQKMMEVHIKDMDLVIIDNFYCLTDNRIANIKPALGWINNLSKRGIAVVVVDHTNREGLLQGSISKERAADLSIKLKNVSENADGEFEGQCVDDEHENQIIVEFPVARSLSKEITAPFVMEKVFTEDTFRFEMVTQTDNAKQIVPDKIKKLAIVKISKEVKKLSYAGIERSTGIKHSAAQDLYKNQMSALTSTERMMLDQEFERLMSENFLSPSDWEDSEF